MILNFSEERKMNPIETKRLIPFVSGEHQLLACGPLSIQPGSTPYRVVLIAKKDGAYSVHNQFFAHYAHDAVHAVHDLTLEEMEKHSHIANGNYFQSGPEGLVKATQKFAERVSEHAQFLASIFRCHEEFDFSL